MRVFLAALLLLFLGGCGPRPEDPRRLRVGYLTRFTHGPALTGLESGRFQDRLGAVRVEGRAFEVGNSVVEALFAGDLDVAYLGPNPAINGWVRSGKKALTLLAGVSSGGSGFVVRRGSGVRGARDLRGRAVASPQIASSADIALRAWLRRHGLVPALEGGDVTVLPLSGPFVRSLFDRGEIEGAWVSEPLLAALVISHGGELLVDEADEWEDGRYLSGVVVVRAAYRAAAPSQVDRFIEAHVAEVDWIEAHRHEALALATRHLERVLGKVPPAAVREAAFEGLHFSEAVSARVLERCRDHAVAEGFLPPTSLEGLVDAEPLRSARQALGRSP